MATDELMEMLQAAAAAQGVPLEWVIRHAIHGEMDEPVEYPFDSPPTSLKVGSPMCI